MMIRCPIKGVSDIVPSSDSPVLTTRDMVNMRGIDPTTKQIRLAMRSGLVKQLPTTVAGSFPVRALRSISFHRKSVLYQDKGTAGLISPLGAADVKWSAIASSARQVPEIDQDRQGNVYNVDGLSGIEKRNSAGELQLKISLPVRSTEAQVRAMRVATIGFVDAPVDGTDAIFAGVSTGGAQSDALMWCYRQVSVKSDAGKPEIKTEKVWEVAPGAFVERIKIRESLMYTAQNEPDSGRSYVRIYANIATAQPDLVREFQIPYPVNDLDVRELDGAMVTAHPPNLLRGIDPTNPTFSARDLAGEWSLSNVADIGKRLWCDIDADSLDLEDGDGVEAALDDGPGFRSLFQSTVANQPVYVKNGIGGKPAIRFVQTSSSYLVSDTNPGINTQYDDQQRTLVPAYTGCKWIAFIVMRVPTESITRPVFDQDSTTVGAGTDCDKLLANKDSRSGVADGANPYSGKLSWLTTTVDITGEGAGGGTVAGATGTPQIPFSMDFANNTGACIVTICHDGGIFSTDAAQHSFIRCNGRPIDRYRSHDQTGLTQTTLGSRTFGTALATFLQADIARIIVLRDYSTGGAHGDPATGAINTGGTSHYPRQIGVFGAPVVTYGAAAGNRYNDNEIERIEGMLAGQYGLSHLLPCGTASVLALTANLAAADTVTIDGTVYTMVAALTVGTSGQVLVGGTGRVSLDNLSRAINNTGVPGTDYSMGMTAHATCFATCVNNESAAAPLMKIETKGLTAVNVTETSATAAWSANPTAALATVATSAVLYMPGHYPHPFNLNFGYPRPDDGATVGVTIESKGKMLASTEGILARWAPNGQIAWVATSRLATVTPAGTLPSSDQKFGGIGYGCAFGYGTSTGVYSVGPMYSTGPAGEAQTAMLRRVVDNKTSVSMTGTGTFAKNAGSLVGAGADSSADYQYPRIAVDTFDNVYLPYYELDAGSGVMSLVCMNKTGIVQWTFRTANTSANAGGLCVIVDKKLPTYDGDPATRAFAVYLGTTQGYPTITAGTSTVYRIEPVSVTQLGVQPTQTRLCAVSNGEFVTSLSGGAFAAPAGTGTLLGAQLDTNPSYVSTASLYGEVFITDGRNRLVYNARLDTLLQMSAKTAGDLRPRARLISAWRGRLIWARFADNPSDWVMSAINDPYDYDLSPPVQGPLQAVQGSRSPKGTGQAPDIVNGLIPFADDSLIFLCESSIWSLDGDPMDGGRFWLVSNATGGAFGNAWCRDEFGTLFFMGSRGVIYRYSRSTGIEPMSDNSIPERLRTIDFSVTRCEMSWSNEDQGFHVFLIPTDSVGAVREHYFWSRKMDGWYPDSFGDANMAPMCSVTGDGDSSSSRSVVLGCADGYLRRFDSSYDDDDGFPILAHCLIGPLQPKNAPLETHFKELCGVLASTQSGCGYSGYATDTPDSLGSPVFSGSLAPGRNPRHFVQAVGAYVAIKVSNGAAGQRFAIESLEMDAFPAGAKRVWS